MTRTPLSGAPAKPSILFINRIYPPQRGSSGRLVRELARAFARDGWDVQVLTADTISSDDPDGPVKVRRITGFSLKHTPLRDLWLLLRLFSAAMFLPRAQIVISLTDPPLLGYAASWVAWFKRSRHIHWCQDVFPDLLPAVGVSVPKWASKLMFRLSRKAMNSADRVVVIGRCMARQLSQNGVQAQKITLIPNWPELAMSPHINTGQVRPPALSDEVITAAQPSITESTPKFRVLYVGTVGYAHPVDTILDAATILDSMHPEIEFLFIGDDYAQAHIVDDKNRRGLHNVRVLPFQPHSRLRDIMESGDIHLLSIKHEAAGMMVPAKFYASLAAARPCILVGPEQTEIGRIISDYHAGAVVPQKAAQQLAQTIIDLRMRDDMWFTAHDGARRAALAYTAEDMIRLWLRKTREMLRHPRG
jgi:colanic acid biosynthesis glycosyl transferase WcaI